MLHLRLPSVLQSIRALEPSVSGLPEWGGLSESKRHDVLLCMMEIVTNAITHGNGLDTGRMVDVSIDITLSEIVIVVADQGGGFDAASLPDPTSEGRRDLDGGRGIHTVRTLADDVTFSRSESGHFVTIRFHR
ncbi:MAG: ATP-binding protein [Candidatus Kapabacteria bacterium]|nr:ATP-binding protein [Candidatus Kapabacteria bacterium]